PHSSHCTSASATINEELSMIKSLSRALLFVSLATPLVSQASQLWSSCQTVSGISNYIAFSNQLIVSLSPGLPCSAPNGVVGAITFTIGSSGVTSSNINTFLAGALSAFSTGQKVMVFYDDAACGGLIFANGGYSAQC